ncbi:MAG: C40 family peptidase [Actinobacteria bacterium]|nr:C40 family peptidase [Actinomycetota bacterium]
MRVLCAYLPKSIAASALIAALAAPAASANDAGWASREIAKVTHVSVLGHSAATFRPQAPLTEQALAAAIAATDKLLAPPPPPPPAPAPEPVAAPAPPPVQVLSTISPDATIAGTVAWQITVPGQPIDHVAFAVDGTQLAVSPNGFFSLATETLADGTHQLAVAATRSDGAQYIAVWNVTTANAPGAATTPLPTTPVPVPITHEPPAPPPPAPVVVATPTPPARTTPPRYLYSARTPERAVTIEELDTALVDYLDLGGAAHEFQQRLAAAGLDPRSATGTEIVARLLGLRVNHPAGEDDLELLPFQSATRAEAAYSFARVLDLGDSDTQWVQQLADSFALPSLTPWQQRILRTAVSYVGYPYVWGGTSPTTETEFGSTAPGGFDCSGFVWRVYKLTRYANEGDLAGVLRGRTTYVMSGEVPRYDRVPASKLQPADTLFFGRGPSSSPNVVDHMGLYLGDGWMIHSSDEGVTIVPFDGWYSRSFAWARRPLREAGLT